VGKFLRPHQRDGVQFMADCVLGQCKFDGFGNAFTLVLTAMPMAEGIMAMIAGAILADDMGLGKTLQSITVLVTLLRQGFEKGKPVVRRALIVCPTSLVSNWANELKKWTGDRIKAVALSEASRYRLLCL